MSTILALPVAPTLAQSQTPSEESETEQLTEATGAKARTLEKVTVTGSRIQRTEVEGPSPVTIISAT
ncbi:hypothetical protein [Xanthomonas sacchari]|nr:hypothetical protein [Xanthomonas sacchari]